MSNKETREVSDNGFPVRIVVFSYCLALAANLLSPIWSAQFFERLGIGRWILSSSALPTTNLWTREGFGKSWYDSSWLFDLTIASVSRHFGEQGLLVAKYISLAACLYLLSAVFIKLSRNITVGLFISSLVFAGAFYQGAFEPSLLGLPLLAVLFLFAERCSSRGILSITHFGVLACGSLLGAIDPRAVAVIPIFGIYFLLRSFEQKTLSAASAILFFVIVLSPFISPYHGLQYLEATGFILDQLGSNIATQSAAANIFNYGWSVMVLLLGCFAATTTRTRPLATDLLFVVFFSLLAAADRNFIGVALLFVGLSYSRYWGIHVEGLQFIPGVVEAFRRFESRLIKMKNIASGTSFVLLCLAFINVYGLRFTPVADGAFYPDEQLILSIKRINTGVLLHDLEVGSFLVYKRSIEMDPLDQQTLPIASLQFPLRKEGPVSETDSWQRLVSREDVQAVVCRSGSHVAELLKLNKKWSEVALQESSPRWKLFSRS